MKGHQHHERSHGVGPHLNVFLPDKTYPEQEYSQMGKELSKYTITYSKGAMNTSTRLNGAGYTNSSGALIMPTVLPAKNVRNSASASSTI